MTMPAETTEAIHFTVRGSALGLVLVAASTKGVSAVALGNDCDVLRNDLANRFPAATLVEGGASVEANASKLIEFMELPSRGLDVALDMRGTKFQRRVWQMLQQIPSGSTASYAEIARRIGKPGAARAVAGACAANALAVAVPCHRVVRSDGSLSGYRWGVERKRALLDAERLSQRCNGIQDGSRSISCVAL